MIIEIKIFGTEERNRFFYLFFYFRSNFFYEKSNDIYIQWNIDYPNRILI